MGESKGKAFEENLAQLERDGFLLIKNALDMETVQKWRNSLYLRYKWGEYDRRNSGGNVSYNQLQEPEMTRALIAHPSVAPYLKATLGKQCQNSRSMPSVMTALFLSRKTKSVQKIFKMTITEDMLYDNISSQSPDSL